MTVKELFKHFNFVPDRIVYFDLIKHENGIIYIKTKDDLNEKAYTKFIEKYKNFEVRSWIFDTDRVVSLMIGDYVSDV